MNAKKISNQINSEALLRSLIREMTETSVIKEGAPDINAERPLWFKIVLDIFTNHESDLSLISPDKNEMFLLLAATIALSGNESSFGSRGDGSARGMLYSKKYQQPAADMAATLRGYGINIGIADTSVGATQTRLSRIEGPEFDEIKRQLGITGAADLDDVSKAIIITARTLKKSYDKARSLGYSTTEPGVNENYPYTWQSTGNAALDLALAAYNGDPDLVLRKWCGEKGATKPCDESPAGSKQYINYIPRYGPKGSDPNRSKGVLSYIERVAIRLPHILSDLEDVFNVRLISSEA